MRSPRLDELVRSVSPESQSPYLQPPFSTIKEGLAQIDAGGSEGLSTDSLREDVEWLFALVGSVQAIIARRVAEIDRREQEGLPDPLQPCTQWLRDRLNLTPNAAYSQVRTARQLDHLPRTSQAFGRGELSAQHVGVICQAMGQFHKTRLDPAEVESELVAAAGQMDPQELLRHWQQLRYQGDQEAEQEQHARRWLRMTQAREGGYWIERQLDAEGGTTLKTAIQGLLGPRQKDDKRTGRTSCQTSICSAIYADIGINGIMPTSGLCRHGPPPKFGWPRRGRHNPERPDGRNESRQKSG